MQAAVHTSAYANNIPSKQMHATVWCSNSRCSEIQYQTTHDSTEMAYGTSIFNELTILSPRRVDTTWCTAMPLQSALANALCESRVVKHVGIMVSSGHILVDCSSNGTRCNDQHWHMVALQKVERIQELDAKPAVERSTGTIHPELSACKHVVSRYERRTDLEK
jgi:hypothetical protein